MIAFIDVKVVEWYYLNNIYMEKKTVIPILSINQTGLVLKILKMK